MTRYVGRFAPSPTGPLHAGSLVAALASWLDARAHGGTWLVRIEDVDAPRCVRGMDVTILAQLAACALVPDAEPCRQSARGARYVAALQALQLAGQVFPCHCTRQAIEAALVARGTPPTRFGERVYPGTCRPPRPTPVDGVGSEAGPRAAWRLRIPEGQTLVAWADRRLGPQSQDVARAVGDYVLRRADGVWSYQLAVVVDDAAQGVTDVVRGGDLADNTARQIVLQRLLALPTPAYLHTPLVRGPDGHKLSKQNGAAGLTVETPSEAVTALRAAGAALGLPVGIAPHATGPADWLAAAVPAWAGMIRGFPPTERHSMITTASGLQYEDTTPGEGAEAQAGKRVKVHYTGWLHDPATADGRGRKFDSSKDRGDPFSFPLGAGHVIGGWDEGVQGMRVGGTRLLLIPPGLGYGARGAGGVIPPNATLLFEVDLLET